MFLNYIKWQRKVDALKDLVNPNLVDVYQNLRVAEKDIQKKMENAKEHKV
jgi:hypothetical protein